MKTAALILSLAMAAPACQAQTNQPDTQTLQAILAELRAMHNDVRLSETTQILLTEWQFQQATVTRILQRRDDLRTELAQTQADRKRGEAVRDRVQDQNGNAILDPAQKKDNAEAEEHLRSQVEELKSREQVLAGALQDAETRLSTEQSALDNIQAQLTEVMKKLQPANPSH